MTTMDFSDLHMTLPRCPERAKLFMSALWFWAYIMYYVNMCITACLRMFLTYTPDSMIIFTPRKETHVLKAVLKTKQNMSGENITNKISAIMKMKWDDDISDADDNLCGGLNTSDIYSIYPPAMDAIIWVAYLMEIDKKIMNTSNENIGKTVKTMLINLKDKKFYKNGKLRTPLNIICGEIPF